MRDTRATTPFASPRLPLRCIWPLQTYEGLAQAFMPEQVQGVQEEVQLREQDFGNFQVGGWAGGRAGGRVGGRVGRVGGGAGGWSGGGVGGRVGG